MFAPIRLFSQLAEAIKLSQSPLLQDRQLSVIIFDHMFEINIFNLVKYSFENRSSGIGPLEQKAILYKYDSVLKQAKKFGYITEDDEALLNFNHGIRNQLYHQGSDKPAETKLAISIYIYLIRKHKSLLTADTSYLRRIGGEGYEFADFGQGLPEDIYGHIDTEEYINNTFDYLVTTIPKWDKFQDLAFSYFEDRFQYIESRIDVIQKLHKNFNFYEAVSYGEDKNIFPLFYQYQLTGRKPKSINNILIISAFIREHEMEIIKIQTSKERDRVSKNLFTKFKSEYKHKYPYSLDLDRKRKTNSKLKNATIGAAVKTFAHLVKDTKFLYLDSKFAAMTLDGLAMSMEDHSRQN